MKLLRPIRICKYLFVTVFFIVAVGCKKNSQKHQIMDQEGYWLLTEQQIQIYNSSAVLIKDTTFLNAGFFDFETHSRKEKKEYKKSGNPQWNYEGDVVFSMKQPEFSPKNLTAPSPELQFDYIQTEGSYLWETTQIYVRKLTMELNEVQVEILEHSESKQKLKYDITTLTTLSGFYSGSGVDLIGSIMLTLTLERL